MSYYHRPDVQVSQPIEKLIQKTLESRAPQLFQKILEIVDVMQRPSPPPPLPPDYPPTDKRNKPPPPEPSNDASNRVQTQEENPGPLTTSALEMPLDLLELSTFSNPLTVRKSIKGKTKTENKDKLVRHSKHDSSEGKGYNREKDGGEKEDSSKQHDDIDDNTNTSNTEIKSDESVTIGNIVDDIPTMTKPDRISDEEDEHEEGEPMTEDKGSSDHHPDTSSNNEGDCLPKTTPTVIRRSTRLASIEEYRKDVSGTGRGTAGTSSGGTKQRRSSVDTDQGVCDVMEINEEAIIEEVIPKSSRKRSAMIISSDSDNDSEGETKGKEEERQRKQPTSRIRKSNRSTATSVHDTSPNTAGDHHSSPEDVREKRTRRNMKRKKL